MNLTEVVVGAAPLVLGSLFVYFAFTVKFERAPTDSWSRFFRYTETQKRVNFLVVGLIAILIGVLLILNGFRIL